MKMTKSKVSEEEIKKTSTTENQIFGRLKGMCEFPLDVCRCMDFVDGCFGDGEDLLTFAGANDEACAAGFI